MVLCLKTRFFRRGKGKGSLVSKKKLGKEIIGRVKPVEEPVVIREPPSGWIEVERKRVEDFAEVTIYRDPLTNEEMYFVLEPGMSADERRVYSILSDFLKKEIKPPEEIEDKKKYVYGEIERLYKKYGFKKLRGVRFDVVRYYVYRDLVGYGPIHAIIRDDDIEDISCNGVNIPIYVWHRKYESMEVNLMFTDEKFLDDYVMKLIHMAGKHVSTARPVVDGMLEGKHRVAVSYKREVTMGGSAFTIRKFREKPFTVTDLIENKTLDEWIAAYTWVTLENRMPLFIIGATAAGKTTLLNCLATLIKPSYKIVTVEETPEINLFHKNWLRFVSRERYGVAEEGGGEISLFDLVKASLRHRPDFLIVGEVRGAEANVMVQAIATGHSGCTTFHAEGVDSAVKRLTQRPLNIAPAYIPLLKVFMVIRRVRLPGTDRAVRRVVEVHEVLGFEGGNLNTFTVFRWNPVTDTFDNFLEQSYNLRKIAEETGLRFRDLLVEVKRRERFLKGLKERGVRGFKEIEEALTSFYSREETKLVEEKSESVATKIKPGGTKKSGGVEPGKVEVKHLTIERKVERRDRSGHMVQPKTEKPLRVEGKPPGKEVGRVHETLTRVSKPPQPKPSTSKPPPPRPVKAAILSEEEIERIKFSVAGLLYRSRGRMDINEIVKRSGEINVFLVLERMMKEGLISPEVSTMANGTVSFYYVLTAKGRSFVFEKGLHLR